MNLTLHKWVIQYGLMGLIQKKGEVGLTFRKQSNVIYHTNRLTKLWLSEGCGTKSNIYYLLKSLSKQRVKRNFLHLRMDIYVIPKYNCTYCWKTKYFPAKIRNDIRIFTLVNSIQCCIGFSNHWHQEKKKKLKAYWLERKK